MVHIYSAPPEIIRNNNSYSLKMWFLLDSIYLNVLNIHWYFVLCTLRMIYSLNHFDICNTIALIENSYYLLSTIVTTYVLKLQHNTQFYPTVCNYLTLIQWIIHLYTYSSRHENCIEFADYDALNLRSLCLIVISIKSIIIIIMKKDLGTVLCSIDPHIYCTKQKWMYIGMNVCVSK
jgi:hypothetical protein